MTTLTKKELAVLKAIDRSEYGDQLTDTIWTFSIFYNISDEEIRSEGITERSLGGIIASLNNKGLVRSHKGCEPNEDTVTITDAGAKVYIDAVDDVPFNFTHFGIY